MRLHLEVEAASRLEQAQQHLAERDFPQRLVEDRFANRPDRRLELIDTGIGRHPAGVEMRLGDPPVVPPKERQKILREVVLVGLGQRSHDAEIERDVTPVGTDHDVSGVHVGVEEAVAKHLREKNLDPGARQHGDIDSLVAQRPDLGDRRAVHALHHQHLGMAPVPVHLGHDQQCRVTEVAPKLASTRRLAQQIEFIVQVLAEFADDFARLEPFAIGPHRLDQPGSGVEQGKITVDDAGDARPQDLHRHLAAVGQRRKMDLRDRGARHRLALERGKHLVHGFAIYPFQNGERLGGRKRGHAVLQGGQFIGYVVRDQVTPRRQHLTELDEDRTQTLQRLTQTFAAGTIEPTPEENHPHHRAQPAQTGVSEHESIEPEPKHHEQDAR